MNEAAISTRLRRAREKLDALSARCGERIDADQIRRLLWGAASRTDGILIRCMPMRRRLFSLASLLSLLLCLATATLWVRSYYTQSQAEWYTGYRDYSSHTRFLHSNFGRLGWTTWDEAANNREGLHRGPGSSSSFREGQHTR